MDVQQAFEAYEHAERIISEADSVDDLDAESDYAHAIAKCPSTWLSEQKRLAQMIILRAFEKAIGRA